MLLRLEDLGDGVQVNVTKIEKMRVAPNWRAFAPYLLLGAASLVIVPTSMAIAMLVMDGGDAPVSPRSPAPKPAMDPAAITATDPTQLRPVSPKAAEALNAAIPVSTLANPAAAALIAPARNTTSLARSLECLTSAIYYEAATEPTDGQRAVAQVILNRVRHPSFPHTICGVVYQGAERAIGCQFSFTCDGSLARRPMPALWARARGVAAAALAGSVYAPVGWATHYHADYVSPYWAGTLTKLAIVGQHIFYRLPGRAGVPSTFSANYGGNEPDMAAIMAATMSKPIAPSNDGTEAAAAYAPIGDRPVLTPSGAMVGTGPASVDSERRQNAPIANRWVLGAGTEVSPPGRAVSMEIAPSRRATK